jgi:hypothetical protein
VRDLAAALAVGEDRRATLGRRRELIAPEQQLVHDAPERAALLGQLVLVSDRPLLVGPPRDQPVVDESLQAVRQDIARDAGGGLQVVETAEAAEQVAYHQQRPALPHDL